MDPKMFCYQCQETAAGKGCTIQGVCGKKPATSGRMDMLIFILKGIAAINTKLRRAGRADKDASRFITEALFTTITNANFDDASLDDYIRRAFVIKNELAGTAKKYGIEIPNTLEVNFVAKPEDWEMFEPMTTVLAETDPNVRGLKQLAIYGLKGTAAYATHARNLGMEDDDIYAQIEATLNMVSRDDISVDELLAGVLGVGENGLKTMALLDRANTNAYGNPEITEVNIGVGKRPGILISGHDLHDLEMLLEQSAGKGVDIYTHSEMLPGNYYPFFKKYPHFHGNYGSAWWAQRDEFPKFNGPILFTTNCIVPPRPNADYADRVYTTGETGYPGFKFIPVRADGTKDFSEIIEHALRCKAPEALESGSIVGGFAHNQVALLKDKIVDAVKSGAIRKFFVMGGCDGRFPVREYYTRFAAELPEDCVILTCGCAKYRYIKLNMGNINGIPRVLDAGQCNDAYSIIRTALLLADAMGIKDVNQLPIVYNIAWYEQKAVIVLLAMLSLGIKNIHVGPTLPAFFTPDILNVLKEKFNIGTITNVDEDLRIMAGKSETAKA